jgi:hypothetical protein
MEHWRAASSRRSNLLEAANSRHEHEWTVWQDMKPPVNKSASLSKRSLTRGRDLDRHLLVQSSVGGTVDVAHCAGRQEALDAIGPEALAGSSEAGPSIDFAGAAAAHGLKSVAAWWFASREATDRAEDIAPALEAAAASGTANLLEIPVGLS